MSPCLQIASQHLLRAQRHHRPSLKLLARRQLHRGSWRRCVRLDRIGSTGRVISERSNQKRENKQFGPAPVYSPSRCDLPDRSSGCVLSKLSLRTKADVRSTSSRHQHQHHRRHTRHLRRTLRLDDHRQSGNHGKCVPHHRKSILLSA